MRRAMSVAELREGGFAVYDQPLTILGQVNPVAAFGSLGEALGFIAKKMAPVDKPASSGDIGGGRFGPTPR